MKLDVRDEEWCGEGPVVAELADGFSKIGDRSVGHSGGLYAAVVQGHLYKSWRREGQVALRPN